MAVKKKSWKYGSKKWNLVFNAVQNFRRVTHFWLCLLTCKLWLPLTLTFYVLYMYLLLRGKSTWVFLKNLSGPYLNKWSKVMLLDVHQLWPTLTWSGCWCTTKIRDLWYFWTNHRVKRSSERMVQILVFKNLLHI